MRPAAPVRLGRGGEPPGLISRIGVSACSRARQAPAPGSMLDPHDDTNVPSGSTDGAQMESTSSPVPREQVLGTVKGPAVTKMPAATRADSDLAAASRPSPKPSPGKSFSRVFVRQTRHAHWLNRTEIQSSAADNQPAANHVAPARSQGCRSITGVSGADGSHPTPRASAKHGALGRRRELMGHCLSHSVRRKN